MSLLGEENSSNWNPKPQNFIPFGKPKVINKQILSAWNSFMIDYQVSFPNFRYNGCCL